jgi:hypothetical protein
VSWTPGMRRQSRIGLLGQLLREPPGSIYSRAKPSFALARVPLKHGWHTHVAPCRTAVFGCIEAPPSSSRLTAAFAPQLLLPTCHAISASPPSRGSRELTVRGSFELIASGRHLHTSSLCMSSPCMVILLLPVAGPILASALPRRRSLYNCPCQGTAVRDLVALRASRSQATTPHLHTRTPKPRAFLVRIVMLLTCLNPPCSLRAVCRHLGPAPALSRLHRLHRARHRAVEPRCAATSACPASAPVSSARSALAFALAPPLLAPTPVPACAAHFHALCRGPLLCCHQPHLLVPTPSPDAAPQRASLPRRAIRAAASFRALHRSLTQLRAAPGAALAHFRSAAARVPEPAPHLRWLPPPAALALLACSCRANRSPAPELGAA